MKEKDGWQGKGFLFVPAKAHATEFTGNILDNLKVRAEEEYRRLLYVGMTRAEDRLIVCGYRGTRLARDTWHDLVELLWLKRANRSCIPSRVLSPSATGLRKPCPRSLSSVARQSEARQRAISVILSNADAARGRLATAARTIRGLRPDRAR